MKICALKRRKDLKKSAGTEQARATRRATARCERILTDVPFKNGDLTVIMKKGKKQALLTREDVAGLNYIKSNSGKVMLTITDHDLGNGKLADIIYEVVENKTISSVDFSNNVPVVRFHVEMKLDLFEIVDKREDEKQSIKQYDVDKKIIEEIEKVVKEEVAKSLRILRETKTDALGVYELMQKADKKAFERFLSSLTDKNDFLSHIVFAVSVESDPF